MATTTTRPRGMDPPAENRTQWSDDEEIEEKEVEKVAPPQQDESEDDESEAAVVEESEEEEEPVEENQPVVVVDKKRDDRALKTLPDNDNAQASGEPSSATPAKSKRVSYSKDMLQPTQQQGVDDSDNKPHQPAYVNKSKQLKATGYGDKIKQGAPVPRDHIEQPVDPNDSLADVYKSQRSTKMKSTGFADKLKEGADVPRDHIPQVEDPNDKLGDMYKSVTKSTGLGEKLKKGEDVRAATAAQAVDKTDQTGDFYASINLRKTEDKKADNNSNNNSGNDTKKYSAKILETVTLQKAEPIVKDKKIKRASLPEVKLQKTTTIVKDGKSATFELPEEFSKAKENLKRRKGSHWYNSAIPEVQPARKWFFQKGEWNDGNTPPAATQKKKSSSWFGFGGSSSPTHTVAEPALPNKSTPAPAIFRGSKTMLNTHKPKVQHYHIVPEEKKGKSAVRAVNKNYYKEIQRRRGLAPELSRSAAAGSVLCTLLMVLVVLPLLVSFAVTYGNQHHPEQMEQMWHTVEPVVEKAWPHVEPVWERVQPHVLVVVEHVQPHVEYTVEKVHPHVTALAERAHPLAVSAVDRVCTPVEEYVPAEEKDWVKPAHGMATASCSWMRTSLMPSTDDETDEGENKPTKNDCDCDSQPERKGLNKFLSRRNKKDGECECSGAGAGGEL